MDAPKKETQEEEKTVFPELFIDTRKPTEDLRGLYIYIYVKITKFSKPRAQQWIFVQ